MSEFREFRFFFEFLIFLTWIQVWIFHLLIFDFSDELAKDVNGAEALLERHAEHKSEIDAREDSFRATAEAGQMLLDSGHYASEEVEEKLSILVEEKSTLLHLWEERRIM